MTPQRSTTGEDPAKPNGANGPVTEPEPGTVTDPEANLVTADEPGSAGLAEPAGAPDGSPERVRRPHRWRRRIANLLILAGVLALLYPLGTCGFARVQQRMLASKLTKTYPDLTINTADYLTDELARQQQQAEAMEKAAIEAERLADLASFRKLAGEFSSSDAKRAGEPIGRIVIPKIGVDVVMIEGTGRSDLAEGPGHWPETPVPGLSGNFVVSGHRTTYGGPFFKLDKLKPGDQIDVLLPYAAVRYRVTRTMIVRPNEVGVVAQRGKEEISLTTCHPIYSARKRLVVQAELDGFKLLQTDPTSAGAR